jgi:hypothetical protein
MKHYYADGFRRIPEQDVSSGKGAAQTFAKRLGARTGQDYISVSQSSTSLDGQAGCYACFIGKYDKKSRSSTGNTVHILVTLK